MLDDKRPRIPLRLLFEIACLLLLVIGGSIFLVLQNTGNKGSTSQATRSTLTMPATSVHGNKTTPTSTPTPIPTATDTPTEQVTPTPTPLFSDDFSNDNLRGWYISNVTGYTRLLVGSGLELTDTNHKSLIESLPTTHKFDDFSLTVMLTLQQGDNNDSTGIYLRGDSNLDHDYRIDIFGNSTYTISKEYLDTDNTPQTMYLVPPTHTSLLKPMGATNMLNVIMKGPTMQLLVNGSIVNTISDPDYTKGQIALFVTNGATSQGVTAIFSSIEIDPASP